MRILQEKNTRVYFLFLIYFMSFFIIWMFFLSWFHGKETQKLLFEREQTMVSGLMEQGVSPALIAGAVKNSESTDEGIALMRQMGHTGSASVRLFRDVRRSVRLFAEIAAGMAAVFAVMLAGLTVRFLWKREKLYRRAVGIITQFSEGNFENHLPQNEDGSIYQLFAAVEELALTLQAQGEKEQRYEEFFKGDNFGHFASA